MAAVLFCYCMVNIDYYEGSIKFILTILIIFSVGILLISVFMLYKLPQVNESLTFKVSKYMDI